MLESLGLGNHSIDYQDSLRKMTAAARDAADFAVARPEPDVWAEKFAGMEFYRLDRHACFWGEDAAKLCGAMADLVAGLHHLGLPFAFVLSAAETDIGCWFGLKAGTGAAKSPDLFSLLSSALRNLKAPDAGTASSCPALNESHAFWIKLSGAPRQVEPGIEHVVADDLCRGLLERNWRFVAYATPRPAADTQQAALGLDNAIAEAESKKAHDGVYVPEAWVKAAQAWRERIEKGILTGLWTTDIWFSSPEAETLARGRALLQSALSGPGSFPDPVRAAVCRDPPVLTHGSDHPLCTTQLASIICPPAFEYPGYEVFNHVRFANQSIRLPIIDGRMPNPHLDLGNICFDGRELDLRLAIGLDDLSSHALIVGVTGSGKTNTCFNILAQLARNDVPFLVIESAKSEYRELLLDPRFRVKPHIFTVGNEELRPLRLNPFEVAAGCRVQTHIDYIKELFKAAFALSDPLPQVLQDSMSAIYQDCGWDLASNTNLRAGIGPDSYKGPLRFPTLEDLIVKAAIVVDQIGYTDRLSPDVKAALLVRLRDLSQPGSKGPMFNTRESFSDRMLFEEPCIIELKSLVSDDEKAFLMGLLLVRLYEYHDSRHERLRKANADSDEHAADHRQIAPGRLHHVTLIEEAHRLLRNVSTGQSNETANPAGKAVEVFANMLAEIRAYGEGIVIAEQIPVKLVPDAIKNTNLKIVHRLLAKEDRDNVGEAMNLAPDQINHLARLERGQAVVYAERLRAAVLIKVPPSPSKDSNNASDDVVALTRPVRAPDFAAALARTRASMPQLHNTVTIAFATLYQSLLVPPPVGVALTWLAIDTAGGFGEAATRLLKDPTLVGDLFVFMLAGDLEARGSKRGWSFADIEEAVQWGGRLAEFIRPRAQGDGEADAMRSERRLRTWVELQTILARLHDMPLDLRPHAECAFCASACFFRENVLDRPLSSAFEGRINDAIRNADFARMAVVLMNIAGEALLATHGPLQDGLVYCHLVHHLASTRDLLGGALTNTIAIGFIDAISAPPV